MLPVTRAACHQGCAVRVTVVLRPQCPLLWTARCRRTAPESPCRFSGVPSSAQFQSKVTSAQRIFLSFVAQVVETLLLSHPTIQVPLNAVAHPAPLFCLFCFLCCSLLNRVLQILTHGTSFVSECFPFLVLFSSLRELLLRALSLRATALLLRQ